MPRKIKPPQTHPAHRSTSASSLKDLGMEDEAIQHFEEMLQLNPADNQGVR